MKRFILNKWETEVFENADKFTAVVFKGRGQYERHEFATEAEALKFAIRIEGNKNKEIPNVVFKDVLL